ncbi:MAG: leucine-rich repeat domain-containing protein [Bacteroidota bacterium]
MKYLSFELMEQLKDAKQWWQSLETQWKTAFSQAFLFKEKMLEMPKNQDLIDLWNTPLLRLAGPAAVDPVTEVELTNLSGIVALKDLTYLSITNMQLTSLETLSQHTKMEYLYVYDNQLTSLKGIENMLNLKELYCQNNQITDLSSLQNLTQLETVYATNNALTSLEGITLTHEEKLRNFRVLPNEQLRHREVIRVIC